jgi:hypothetical protein
MKLRKYISLLCCCLLIMNTQCDEDDDGNPSQFCDELVIIDNNQYQNIESDFYSLVNVTTNSNCLEVTISASGCSGESWEMILVDSGDIAESMPPQRYLKFASVNNEACLAVFSRTVSFDLTALEIQGNNEITLNIEDFPEPLSYNY